MIFLPKFTGHHFIFRIVNSASVFHFTLVRGVVFIFLMDFEILSALKSKASTLNSFYNNMNIIHYFIIYNENIKLKPTQKFLVLSKDILVIHNDARKAFNIWHQFRPKTLDINMHALDDHYCQPLRLVAGLDDTYYFCNDISSVDILIRE